MCKLKDSLSLEGKKKKKSLYATPANCKTVLKSVGFHIVAAYYLIITATRQENR